VNVCAGARVGVCVQIGKIKGHGVGGNEGGRVT
jgi:hypothetical protein